MENQKVEKQGWCKAAFILGIIAMVFALLPLLSFWFIFLTFINYVLVPIAIICGVMAFVKSQNQKKTIIGLALAVVAILLPFIMPDAYVESAADTAANSIGAMKDMGAFEKF